MAIIRFPVDEDVKATTGVTMTSNRENSDYGGSPGDKRFQESDRPARGRRQGNPWIVDCRSLEHQAGKNPRLWREKLDDHDAIKRSPPVEASACSLPISLRRAPGQSAGATGARGSGTKIRSRTVRTTTKAARMISAALEGLTPIFSRRFASGSRR